MLNPYGKARTGVSPLTVGPVGTSPYMAAPWSTVAPGFAPGISPLTAPTLGAISPQAAAIPTQACTTAYGPVANVCTGVISANALVPTRTITPIPNTIAPAVEYGTPVVTGVGALAAGPMGGIPGIGAQAVSPWAAMPGIGAQAVSPWAAMPGIGAQAVSPWAGMPGIGAQAVSPWGFVDP